MNAFASNPTSLRGPRRWRWLLVIVGAAALLALAGFLLSRRHGPRHAYLNLPKHHDEELPRLLSLTGAFADVRSLTPAAGLVEYEVNAPLWSDGAAKRRWINVPRGTFIKFSNSGNWEFPAGTVFIKHFETTDTPPRRIETRLLVRDASGGIFGMTYRWRDDQSDAELVDRSSSPLMQNPGGGDGQIHWSLMTNNECRACHIPESGLALGVNTRQLNLPINGENQLVTWSRLGLLDTRIDSAGAASLPRLANPDDISSPLESRARAYLDANCAICHRPGAALSKMDLRIETPLHSARLIDAPPTFASARDSRQIAPGDPEHSEVLKRMLATSGARMPPLARSTIDRKGSDLIRQWITELTPAAGHDAAN